MSRRKFSLAGATMLRITPNGEMLSDMYQVAPTNMWALTSKPARILMAAKQQHPRAGVKFGFGVVSVDRPSSLLDCLERYDVINEWCAVTDASEMRTIGDRSDIRVLRSNDFAIGINADWYDIWTQHECIPFVYRWNTPIMWLDKGGKRIGYTMPVSLGKEPS